MKTQALLSIVTITGLWSLSLCLSHQYHFVNDQMSWTDAQQYCRDKFTDLATIHTLEDVNTLTHTVDSKTKAVWIGLYNSGRWSLADERFYKDAEEHKFRKWAPGEPGDKLCAAMYDNGEWKAGHHEYSRFPICFDDGELTRKYIIIKKALTWAQAQKKCREEHTDLASVRNQAENQEIQKILNGVKSFWIGLCQGSWKWSDGSNSSFRQWQSGQPNGLETCTAMVFGSGSKWEDKPCHQKASFICYGAAPVKKPVLRVKLTINSSLDVNDPAVQDAILEQLQQKVKDHQGSPADIKVRWVQQADGRIFHKEDKKKKREEACSNKEGALNHLKQGGLQCFQAKDPLS